MSAFEWQYTAYIFVAAFVAYAWDWLLSISEEYKVVASAGITSSNAIYFISRLGAFGHLLLMVFNHLVPRHDCAVVVGMLGACSSVSVASTSLLFLLRLRAIYMRSRNITAVFCALWLVTMALILQAYASLKALHVPQTEYCLEKTVTSFTAASLAVFFYDTLIFLAITYRLAADAVPERNWRSCLLSILKGQGLSRLSRALMQSGQIYYLATILVFIFNLIVIWSPFVPLSLGPGAHYIVFTIYNAFTNIMACRVFRGVALGMMHFEESSLSTTVIDAAFQLQPLPSSRRR
ncbi:hypothetical protein FIBSPDRAFT_943344 [Athelia psychrophila]|uniref:DUF6533 domain-containing protein n=1 Tax=Athelia psychrophila TaxID=1759441 RepID=A0A166WAB4_9AGAM|nr:hypothetical protein FIBSPDRAFT_943344 [Fibularhizoctonia sp. CBS 109695]